jgi:hypothetical protein
MRNALIFADWTETSAAVTGILGLTLKHQAPSEIVHVIPHPRTAFDPFER